MRPLPKLRPLCRSASILLLILAAPLAPLGAQDLDGVLARARADLGLDAAPAGAGFRATGSASYLGTQGRASLSFDRRGRFCAQTVGPLGQTVAFDGDTVWEIDMGDSWRVLELTERERELVGAWIVTGDWVARAAELGLAVVRADPGPDPAEGSSLPVRLEVRYGDLRGTLELEPDSARPGTLTLRAGASETLTHYREWRAFGDLWLPGRIESHQGGLVTRLVLEHAAPLTAPDEGIFASPGPSRAGLRFSDEVPAALDVVRAPTGHLLAHVLVDGRDLGRFIFDTGAGIDCISLTAARELGLEPFGEILAVGTGGAVASPFHRVRQLAVGPVTLDDHLMMGLDLDFLEVHMGQPIAGILGYSLLSRVTARIDTREGRVALFDPVRYEGAGHGWEELSLYQRHPCVHASFEGHGGLFRLDTGAAQSTVTFHAPAVERLGLLEGRETRPTGMGGVGGIARGREGRLADFVLAGHRFEAPRAAFAQVAEGAFAEPSTLGNIGGRFLDPFVLVTDYGARRIAFLARE